MDGRLHDVINRIPIPRQPEQLDGYKQALRKTLDRFRQEQDSYLRLAASSGAAAASPPARAEVVINKLENVIRITKEAINKGSKKPGFFDSQQNQTQLVESQARIAAARKLIAWLGGDKTVTFTDEEKQLLSKPGSSVALILKNNQIDIEKLPKPPSSKPGEACSIM